MKIQLSALALVAAVLLQPSGARAELPAVGPGETLLQITASGSSRNRPDMVVVNVPIVASGASSAEARAAAKAQYDALRKALVEKGVPESSIAMVPFSNQWGFLGNAAIDPQVPLEIKGGVSAIKSPKFANSMVRITFNDPALLEQVTTVLDSLNQAMIGGPAFSLQDDRSARAAATANAMENARSQANIYAASLGLHTGRVLRVSNYGSFTATDPDYDSIVKMMAGAGTSTALAVETRVNIWVDFAMVK